MKIFLKIFFLLFSLNVFAVCEFKESVQGVASFSGSATVLFKELGLLQNPKLKAISIFHPILEKEFSGKVLPGGIFLSQQGLSELANQVVFYDESRDLRKILQSREKITSIEIKTRNLTPEESVNSTLKLIRPFLYGCEDKEKELNKKISQIESELLKIFSKKISVIFYLGKLKQNRPPEMLIVQDGVVKWLLQNDKIKTYPSGLAYVNWSAKIMQQMPLDTLHVGVVDSGRDGVRSLEKSGKEMTLIYPGALVPGLSQLEAFLFWAKSLR